jgi:hypothetical protein
MAAKKFLRNVAGRITEIIATVVSSGVANDGDVVALDTTGRLDVTVLPVGVGPDVKIHPSSENLAAGDWINIWLDVGTLKVRKADATAAGKEADGFVLANVTAPANATVFFGGINTALASLTLGAQYFLSTTPGVGVATTPPSASGNVVQRLGKAISATEIESDLGNIGILVA